MKLLCLLFGHKHIMNFHKEGVYWCYSAGGYDCVCERNCGYRWEQTEEGLKVLLKSRERDPRTPSYQAIRGLLSWTYGGACSDCDMFREAPSCIDFVHHKDCAHLQDINFALKLLGRLPEEGHDYEDPQGEMKKLAEERTRQCREEGLIK